jgi:hypothetical protein
MPVGQFVIVSGSDRFGSKPDRTLIGEVDGGNRAR